MATATKKGVQHHEAIKLQPMGKYAHNGNVATEHSQPAGDSSQSSNKRSLYERNGVAVCSQKRALAIAAAVFAALFAISLILAFAGSRNDCPCADQGEDDEDYEPELTMPKSPKATNGEPYPWTSLRLPDFVKPLRYNLTIHPNLTTYDVKGQVSIEFTTTKDVNFLVLHIKNITITDKTLEESNGALLNVSSMLEFAPGQQLYIEALQTFKAHLNYTLKLRFVYRLSHELEGFYVSSYTTPDGERRVLATTHFEATYARAAFPCFDEPHFKARFKISIFRDRFHISLTNMPVQGTEDAGFYMGTGLLRDDFEESVPMSTYLVAFVVCDYKRVSLSTERHISVSVYAPEHQLGRAQFALGTATTLMDFFEDFFNVSYPLPKQDLIAIPDFAAGAMENWGLITYRETSILYDESETSSAAHQWVAIVIAHELAHQWFGNLVTMRWWSDLWLNEGFASFLEYVGVSHVRPDWAMLEQFVVDKTQPALALDALASSHPISVEVRDPSEIEAIFDAISYSKGAAIIAMLEGFLGRDSLRQGLQLYLLSHEFDNADTTDLWNALSENAPHALHVKSIMDTWTLQMGFPLVTVDRNGTEVTATQSRFLMAPGNGTYEGMPSSPFEYKWYIPLSYRTDKLSHGVTHVWMNLSDVSFTLPEETQWFKANVNQAGFYRVNYDTDTWRALVDALRANFSVFSPADRASLIDDAFTLCRAGVLGPELPLEMSLYLIKERHYAPWITALDSMQGWARRLSESAAYRLFMQHMQGILSPAVNRVGWNDTGTHLQKLLRGEILNSAVLSGVPSAVRQAKRLFADWMTQNKRVPPNLREVVYTAGIKYGGEAEWEFCWSRYNSTAVPSERRLLLKALGLASDPWLLQRFLQASLDRHLVKPQLKQTRHNYNEPNAQDLKLVFAVVASNPEGRLLAWRHVRANWRKLQNSLGNSTAALGGLVGTVTSHFSSPYDVEEVSSFLKALPRRQGNQRVMRQSLENIQLNARWVRSSERLIAAWLREHEI